MRMWLSYILNQEDWNVFVVIFQKKCLLKWKIQFIFIVYLILIEREGKDHQMWTTGQNSFKKLMLINSFVNISKRSKFFSFIFRVISPSSFDEVILNIFPKYCVYLSLTVFYIYFPFSFLSLFNSFVLPFSMSFLNIVSIFLERISIFSLLYHLCVFFNSFVLPFYLYYICLSVVSIIASCFVRWEMQLSNRSRMTIN